MSGVTTDISRESPSTTRDATGWHRAVPGAGVAPWPHWDKSQFQQGLVGWGNSPHSSSAGGGWAAGMHHQSPAPGLCSETLLASETPWGPPVLSLLGWVPQGALLSSGAPARGAPTCSSVAPDGELRDHCFQRPGNYPF